MVDVEPVQFSVGYEIHSGQLLRLKNHRGRVLQGLSAGRLEEPVDSRITADNGCFNGWLFHKRSFEL
jgi:hypothetical protein